MGCAPLLKKPSGIKPEGEGPHVLVTGRTTVGGFNFRELVTKDVNKKIQEAKQGSNSTMEEKLLRINGFVQRRIVRDYPYTDDYQIGKVVGSGASGDVFQAKLKKSAKWMAAQKDVVLKTLPKSNISAKKLEELVAETEVGLILDHPLICRLLRVYETEKDVTLVLEYCSGGDMFDRFAEKGKYSEPMAQQTCVQMLTALKYLQSQKVVHRDIKLENWLYANKQETSPLCITDFGFATYFDPLDEPMTNMMGSSYYIAPEILKQSYGHQCDMWSTGIVTYMLLSGRAPFGGDTVNEIFQNVLTEDLAFPTSIFSEVSQDAQDFLTYVINRNVEERPGPSQALNHPWLRKVQNAAQMSAEARGMSVDSLVAFANQPELRRAALVVMGGGASNVMFRDARAAFLDLDLTGSGTISMESFKRHLRERDPDLDEVVIEDTFSRLDVHKNGEIHYSEFLAAYDQISLVDNADAISRAFAMFDSDKTGFITKENLEEVFKGQLSEEKELLEFERMLEDAGCSDKRGMDLNDFTKMVKTPRHDFSVLSPKFNKRNSDAQPDMVDVSLEGSRGAKTAETPNNASAKNVTTPSSVPRTTTLHHDTIVRMKSVQVQLAQPTTQPDRPGESLKTKSFRS
jgi:calcium-dependent protein kinase